MTGARLLATLCAFAIAACVAAPPLSPALAGTRWAGAAGPRLEFSGEGRLSGFTGCNSFNGSWRVEGDAALLGPIATTKRFCVGPEGDVERRVLAVLVDRSRITREGAKLVLRSPAGERYEFEAAP